MTDFQSPDSRAAPLARDRHGPLGATWPVSPLALAALVDMGMTDETIGRYFGVDPAEVRRERKETPS
jgi:hypothetical protein